MKKICFVTMLLLVVMLAGCDKLTPATPAAATTTPYTSKTLDASHEGALSAAEQLSLGTLQLEGTDKAVTPEQAKTLLPLWQALQGTAVQTDAEQKAVYGQIEAAMTAAQLQAIAAMKLSQQDLQGGGMLGPGDDMTDEQRAAVQATMEAGGAAGTGGRQLFGGDMTDEQRAAMQATMGASDGAGGRQFGGNMSDEQRAAMRATFEAGGGPGGGARSGGGAAPGGRQFGGGSGQNSFVINALIRLLTERAAQSG
ncbi:MAG: hypothetical protein JW850_20610 [Thermoflexales bacterium]|nr:hypothetical protein [Thermoflexales bacterium]